MKLLKIMLYDEEVYTAPKNPTAKSCSYDNSRSQLTSINVQDAIDEVLQFVKDSGGSGGGGASSASNVSYDNAITNLASTDVQNAIGELLMRLSNSENIDYDNTGSGLKSDKVKTAIDEVTKKINDHITGTAVPTNAGYSNSIYRGKDITSVGLDKIYEVIKDGTFKDLYVGDIIFETITVDSIEINVKFAIAGFNLFPNALDQSGKAFGNHITLIPVDCILPYKMCETDDTSAGYIDSVMNGTELPKIDAALTTIFGDKLLQYNMKLSNALGADNKSHDVGDWPAKSCLMSEMQVFGTMVLSNLVDNQSMFNQFPIFRLNPSMMNSLSKQAYWLSGVASATEFCCYSSGLPSKKAASTSLGIRPFINIGFMA